MREPPQPVRDHVQELASSGRGNRDGSLRSRNSDRNWPSQGRGTGMYLFGFGVVQGVLGNKAQGAQYMLYEDMSCSDFNVARVYLGRIEILKLSGYTQA